MEKLQSLLKRIRRHHIRQIIVYGMVGGTSAVVAAIAYLSFCWLHLSPLLATFLGNGFGMIVSYSGHTRYTFRKTHRFSQSEFTKFIVTSLIGLASNALWVHLLVNVLNLNHTVAVYPMIFFTPLITFLISKFWAFR